MSAATVAFVDPMAPVPYDGSTSRRQGLGGTEQMVARLAVALASDRPVTVAQGARRQLEASSGVVWHPMGEEILGLSPGTVVLVQHWKLLPRLRRAHPDATLLLWLHCFLGRHAGRRLGAVLEQTGAHVVCVSAAHARAVVAQLLASTGSPALGYRCGFVYNALEEELGPDRTIERDPRLLLSLSSRHKGQEQVLANFAAVRRHMPDMRLLIADPGYFGGTTERQPGVGVLGTLARPAALGWLARASCLFYPQSSFEETFGLVFAEANAVGTPVLAHPHGAAPELLDARQLVDADQPDEVVRRLIHWRFDGPPRVELGETFRIGHIAGQWRELIDRGGVSATGLGDSAEIGSGCAKAQ